MILEDALAQDTDLRAFVELCKRVGIDVKINANPEECFTIIMCGEYFKSWGVQTIVPIQAQDRQIYLEFDAQGVFNALDISP